MLAMLHADEPDTLTLRKFLKTYKKSVSIVSDTCYLQYVFSSYMMASQLKCPLTQHMSGFITILYVNKMPVQINIFRWGWITMTEFFKGTALDIVLVLVKHICTWEPNQANILKWIKAKNISHHP